MTREILAHPVVLALLVPRERKETPAHKETRVVLVHLVLLVSVA